GFRRRCARGAGRHEPDAALLRKVVQKAEQLLALEEVFATALEIAPVHLGVGGQTKRDRDGVLRDGQREQEMVFLWRWIFDLRRQRLLSIDDGVELTPRAFVAKQIDVLRLDLLVIPECRVLDRCLERERRAVRGGEPYRERLAERDELLFNLE